MTSVDDVLQRVARGELTPDEAVAELDRLGVGRPPAEPPPAPDDPFAGEEPFANDDPFVGDEPFADEEGRPGGDATHDGPAAYPFPDDREQVVPEADLRGAGGDAGRPPPPPPGRNGPGRAGTAARVLRLRVPARAVAVYADPAVAEVQVASGPCALRRVGDALVVEHSRWRGGGDDDGRFRFVDQLPRQVAAVADDRVILRVNPAILLDIELTAGSLKVWGCSAGLRLRMTAGSAKIDRVEGPLALDLHSSSLKGTVAVTGESSLRCESSSVKMTLLPGSDVRIEATNRMGKLVLPTRRSRTGGGERATATVGAGRGRLAVDARMSSVMIGSYR